MRIWERTTTPTGAVEIWETTSEILDDDASFGSIGFDNSITTPQFDDDRIISLDSDGFTVDDRGFDTHPNTSSQVYNYMALG